MVYFGAEAVSPERSPSRYPAPPRSPALPPNPRNAGRGNLSPRQIARLHSFSPPRALELQNGDDPILSFDSFELTPAFNSFSVDRRLSNEPTSKPNPLAALRRRSEEPQNNLESKEGSASVKKRLQNFWRKPQPFATRESGLKAPSRKARAIKKHAYSGHPSKSPPPSPISPSPQQSPKLSLRRSSSLILQRGNSMSSLTRSASFIGQNRRIDVMNFAADARDEAQQLRAAAQAEIEAAQLKMAKAMQLERDSDAAMAGRDFGSPHDRIPHSPGRSPSGRQYTVPEPFSLASVRRHELALLSRAAKATVNTSQKRRFRARPLPAFYDRKE